MAKTPTPSNRRDQFAAAALTGLIAAADEDIQTALSSEVISGDPQTARGIAHVAFTIADAMVAVGSAA